MSNLFEEFKEWPIKERIFLSWEEYSKCELNNLLKYKNASIDLSKEVIVLQKKSLKNEAKELKEIFKRLKELDI